MAKDQFLAMLSHEVPPPLTPVLASALALENEPELPNDIHESLQMIRRNVELEARLIDDLLDLTRIDRGKVQLNFEIVDADTLLHNALEICQAEIDRKHLAHSLKPGAQKVHMRADPARLQQIFWNLINNAVKFTPPNGQITITTTNDSGGKLRVEIADTGMGIEPEAMPKIFDAFEQGGRTQLGGLGLGLAISKTLVEGHKGTITAQSAGRNKGSTFTLVFPTCEKVEERIAPAALPRLSERQPLRILLVEDHEDTNRSLTNLLRRRGYHVQSALNFQSAVNLGTMEQFDVLISDLALPDGSGIDLMQKLHSTQPLFAIALTGFGMEEDVRKSYEAGFQHHLVKPIDLNKLDSLIQEGAAALTVVCDSSPHRPRKSLYAPISKSLNCAIFGFARARSSIGQSVGLRSQRLWVRPPPGAFQTDKRSVTSDKKISARLNPSLFTPPPSLEFFATRKSLYECVEPIQQILLARDSSDL